MARLMGPSRRRSSCPRLTLLSRQRRRLPLLPETLFWPPPSSARIGGLDSLLALSFFCCSAFSAASRSFFSAVAHSSATFSSLRLHGVEFRPESVVAFALIGGERCALSDRFLDSVQEVISLKVSGGVFSPTGKSRNTGQFFQAFIDESALSAFNCFFLQKPSPPPRLLPAIFGARLARPPAIQWPTDRLRQPLPGALF